VLSVFVDMSVSCIAPPSSAHVASAGRHCLLVQMVVPPSLWVATVHTSSVRRVLLARGAISGPRVARFVARLLRPLTLSTSRLLTSVPRSATGLRTLTIRICGTTGCMGCPSARTRV